MALVRLQKYFTDCGVMSRRAAEEQIRQGLVKVNGSVAHIGDSIDPEKDKVEYNGKIIIPYCDEKICVMLNKPRGYVTTMSDERGRKNVSMLVSDLPVRVYPIGRLDMDSDGLLLLTNDGALAEHLTHPRHDIPKIYHVTVKGKVSEQQLLALNKEMVIDGYRIMPVKTTVHLPEKRDPELTVLEMTLFEGRNRQIRKMCDTQSLKITRLCRVAIGKVRLGSLPTGKYRRLSRSEIAYLLGKK
ncbi:MAG: rRNA pseudouridine synthase [Ruminococcaceae bacterium]|nr:rRNA pseudouridine synthase [Oscillospiraceae bacterium]